MKRRVVKIVFLLAGVFLLTLPLNLWLQWYFSESKELKIFILDKTVLNKKPQEHVSFNWVLKQHKYVKGNNEFYVPNEDYYGFFPEGKGDYIIKDINERTKEELEMLADEYDMAYYTDLYGIYWIEWHNEYPEIKPDEAPGRVGERSASLYGGLTQNELELLLLMKERKKLIINEFNIIASPTSWSLRHKYERAFNVHWSGWVGRHFESLDTTINKELPLWLIRNYREQNNGEWPFTKSGIAFVNNGGSVAILEDETHLYVDAPVIITPTTYADYYAIPERINYTLWFDVCATDTSNQVISNYIIKSNSKGDSILDKWHIPNEFPAVIKRKRDYPFYYFAGDFADNPIPMRAAKFKHVDVVHHILFESSANEPSFFFWTYYRPLVTRVLDDYYKNLKSY